ncbi:ribosomal biogenesis protein LAS1L [Megalops cyprinoides]|uniref:ribosomal biogenesis protein LAS1L n=1 Tax=Megalops cyprinoides TaxID=118141 RepID=UPI00186422F1|nr:ribosomal biogenesis protein LAS1L [Megalops cyprinoides]
MMKRKSSEKSGHVVAWINKAEWDQILEYLYSKDSALQKFALHRISAWKGRFGNSTPVAVESTADLVRCQVLDSSGHLETDDLVLLYGTALVRFVNLITERKQKRVATPLRRLANKMNIPEWIVNLRHDITHRRLPTLKWCRKGCQFVLEWLQQEYWSRQLGSQLAEDWDSQSEEDEEEEGEELGQEDELTVRQRNREAHKKARELLISYEKEQFQVFDGLHKENRAGKPWPSPSSDLGWILIQIKDFAVESSTVLVDMMLSDGFLVPTAEQLESLDIDLTSDCDPMNPCIPRLFLRFWLPLLKLLNSLDFIHLFLERLFLELQLSEEDSQHRTCYLAGWISEIFACNRHKNTNPNESKAQKKGRLKDMIFTKPIPLQWQKLLTCCLDAPCIATPHLLQQILEGMEHPLPLDTQQKLLQLCCIYTQGGDPGCSPDAVRRDQPVYTLESLRKRIRRESERSSSAPPPSAAPRPHKSLPLLQMAEATEDLQEQLSPDVLAERVASLRGSPWQVCTDSVKWKDYPLGKVPGQSEDPSCLMVDSYSSMSVLDQHVEVDKSGQHSAHICVSGPHRPGSDGPLWTHSDLSKLKSGLQLF